MRSLALHGQHLAELYIMPDIMRSLRPSVSQEEPLITSPQIRTGNSCLP
uniref:Uncharacterized protein n=1 Tax=Anguilla anguilla TaxID=7936 RepID=A0A0E9RKD0_ANGAN